MELREILLVLHIVGAATWFGADIVQALAPSMAARQSQQAAAGWYRVAAGLSTRLYMPAAILILVTGIWMVLEIEAFSFGSLFVNIGFAMIVVGVLLGVIIFGPGSVRAAEAIESGDQGAVKTTTRRIAVFGTVDTFLMLFTIGVMVLRLGA